jgi:hypothetical protein
MVLARAEASKDGGEMKGESSSSIHHAACYVTYFKDTSSSANTTTSQLPSLIPSRSAPILAETPAPTPRFTAKHFTSTAPLPPSLGAVFLECAPDTTSVLYQLKPQKVFQRDGTPHCKIHLIDLGCHNAIQHCQFRNLEREAGARLSIAA